MHQNTMRMPCKRTSAAWLPALGLAVLAGCSTVQVTKPTAPVAETPVQDQQRAVHWQFDAGQRPPADRDGYRPPVKLAVLLPLTGSLADAAAPVRDGLLTAYYGEQRRRPELKFYDTAGTAAGAVAAYQKAVADGADQVLGPLGRDEVDAVFRGVQPNVPVLALNRPATPAPTNSASFALAPEDSGIAAADYLVAHKALHVLALSAGDDYARRSVDALGKQLQAKGGSLVQTLIVSGDKPGDMTTSLQAAAQREGGVDAVFLALRASQARAIAPQLAAAGLSTKPRVATPVLTSGLAGDAGKDAALDGIVFPSETWTARGVSGLPSAASLGGALPTARGGAARLFAFGYDAWRVTAYLEYLATSADTQLSGATGNLRIDEKGNVLRTPTWSTLNGGVQTALPDVR